MATGQDKKEFDQLVAAEDAGYKFMKVYLNKTRVSRGQKEVFIHGVKQLKAYGRGRNEEGIDEWEFVKDSGLVKFKLDRRERAYIGYLWDDNDKTKYGWKGYNRNILATHIETGDFIIKDEDILKSIHNRLEKIKAFNAKHIITEEEKIEKISVGTDEKDLDEQIKFLQAKKEMINKSREKEKPTRRPANRRSVKEEAPEIKKKSHELAEA